MNPPAGKLGAKGDATPAPGEGTAPPGTVNNVVQLGHFAVRPANSSGTRSFFWHEPQTNSIGMGLALEKFAFDFNWEISVAALGRGRTQLDCVECRGKLQEFFR
ncbi:MAG: hypothetical protein SFX18_06345 [Pirellulales bacterium]|nr:hypothetical protein [Pirellulales bacterium]